MKYDNFKVYNSLTSYSWFERGKQSHFTVNKSMIACIYSAIFFHPFTGKAEKKVLYPQYKTNYASFCFYIIGILKFQTSEQILLKRCSYAPQKLAIIEILKYCRNTEGILQFDFFFQEKQMLACSASDSKNLKHCPLFQKYIPLYQPI